MAANVETMFSVREVPWHGLGTIVKEAPTSADAIRLAGLDWKVEQKEIFLADGTKIEGSYANVRDIDNKPLGIVGERYKIVNNSDAFEFTDELLNEGAEYETAGSLKNGKQIWLLARLSENYKILGDEVTPYCCFTNTHDGTGAIKVAMTPVRVVCNNTLNLALKKAKRTWSARHTQTIKSKMSEARETLGLAKKYMNTLQFEFEEYYKVKLNKDKVISLVDDLVPIKDDETDRKKENLERIKRDIIFRYEEAPDLKVLDQTGARFIQAVSDSVSHIEPRRITANYQENSFNRIMNFNNELLDRATRLIKVAV